MELVELPAWCPQGCSLRDAGISQSRHLEAKKQTKLVFNLKRSSLDRISLRAREILASGNDTYKYCCHTFSLLLHGSDETCHYDGRGWSLAKKICERGTCYPWLAVHFSTTGLPVYLSGQAGSPWLVCGYHQRHQCIHTFRCLVFTNSIHELNHHKI